MTIDLISFLAGAVAGALLTWTLLTYQRVRSAEAEIAARDAADAERDAAEEEGG